MSDIANRSGGFCEFCSGAGPLTPVALPPGEDQVLICGVCQSADLNDPHWRCLEGAVWNPEPAVQIAVWRKLAEIGEAWAIEAQGNIMMEPDVAARAAAQEKTVVHKDSNGAVLSQGDTVVLIKDLPVKGGGFTAKRGTAVRGISLVPDVPEHIEGRVEGQRIVILTQFVKKK